MSGSKDDSPAADPLLRAVGSRIRLLRSQAGHTQRSFAAAAGMPERYAYRIEAGLQNITLRTLARVASALKISMSEVLDGVVVEGHRETDGDPT